MGMTVAPVTSFRLAEENAPTRVQAGTEWFAENAVLEVGKVAIQLAIQLGDFLNELGWNFVVRINRQQPIGLNQRKSPIALVGEMIEFPLVHLDIGKPFQDFQSRISTEAVDDDNPVSPAQTVQRVGNVCLFVVGQDQGGDFREFHSNTTDCKTMKQTARSGA